MIEAPPSQADARRRMLLDALEDLDGERPTVVSSRLATGGNSHENWIFDVQRKRGSDRLVLRCDPDGWIRPEEMEREVTGLKIAEAVGVPAPRLVASHHDRPADRPYTIVDFVEGESIPRRIDRDPALAPARRDFGRAWGAIIGRLAAAPLEVAGGLETRDPVETLQDWYARADAPEPLLAGAIVWLAANVPPARAPAVVHGDFRLGNPILGEDGVRAVLDWETAHLGDPHEDLAWLCQRAWRYGDPVPVDGLGAIEELFAGFDGAGAGGVDVDRFHWWLVWVATWWALVCRSQAMAQREGAGYHIRPPPWRGWSASSRVTCWPSWSAGCHASVSTCRTPWRSSDGWPTSSRRKSTGTCPTSGSTTGSTSPHICFGWSSRRSPPTANPTPTAGPQAPSWFHAWGGRGPHRDVPGRRAVDHRPAGLRDPSRLHGQARGRRIARRAAMSVRSDRRHGVVGDLTPEDDLMHPLSEDRSHNESMFFNFFDSERRTGGFVRIGNRPNEGHAEMTFCIFLSDRSVLFQWGRPGLSGNDALDAAGLAFEVVDPGEHLRIRFAGEAVRLTDPMQMVDPGAAMRGNPRVATSLVLDCRATSPLIGSATGDPAAVIFLKGVGHYQQTCAYAGTLIYGDQTVDLRALGVRDHSWGRRVWHDIYMDRSFWACASEGLGMIACKTWNHDAGGPDIVGCVVEGGAAHRLKSVGLTTRYADGSARHQGFDLDVTDERGRTFPLRGEALAYIPLRHRRPDRPLLHLGQAMSRFTLADGPPFLGLSEYFDAQSSVDAITASPQAGSGISE